MCSVYSVCEQIGLLKIISVLHTICPICVKWQFAGYEFVQVSNWIKKRCHMTSDVS